MLCIGQTSGIECRAEDVEAKTVIVGRCNTEPFAARL